MASLLSLYDLLMLPLEWLFLRRLRRRLYPYITGRVLELGVGTGANLPLYSATSTIVATDLRFELLCRARRRARKEAHLFLVQADALDLPFQKDTFDHVVASLVFCSVADPLRAAQEAHRVLRPGGWFVLLEHVRGQARSVRTLTRWLEGPWLKISKSCHLARDTVQTVQQAGFRIICTTHHLGSLLQIIIARKPSQDPSERTQP